MNDETRVPTVRVVRLVIAMMVDNVGNSVSIRTALLFVTDKQLTVYYTAASYGTECD